VPSSCSFRASSLVYFCFNFLLIFFWLVEVHGYSVTIERSMGLEYANNWGRKYSNILVRSQRALQVWLITSRHTIPEASTMLGWKILFMNPQKLSLILFAGRTRITSFKHCARVRFPKF
jgi:hypothetical protein